MAKKEISPVDLIVRCYAESLESGQWQAFSLDFGLAAQADTFDDVKNKLDGMIQSYLYDALVGEDREHAAELLSRKASFSIFARYYLARFQYKIQSMRARSISGESVRAFAEPWGLLPKQQNSTC